MAGSGRLPYGGAMSESDVKACQSRISGLVERVEALERRVLATDLTLAALVSSWFPALPRREQKRVLAEMKAAVRVHRKNLSRIPDDQKAAAEEFIAGMRRLRRSLKA